MKRNVLGSRDDDRARFPRAPASHSRGGTRSLAALLIAACGLLVGCSGDEVGEGSSVREVETTVLAQVRATTDAPEQDRAQVSSTFLPVTFILQFGDGCPGDPITRPGVDGRLEVRFLNYRVTMRPDNPDPYDLKTCLVDLRVVGAQDYQVAVSRITYSGLAMLITPGTELRFTSSVRWFGRSPSSVVHNKLFEPPLTGDWATDHEIEAVNATWSDCTTEPSDSDRLTIATSMILYSDPPSAATATLQNIGIEALAASIGVPPPAGPTDTPAMIIEFQAQRCAR